MLVHEALTFCFIDATVAALDGFFDPLLNQESLSDTHANDINL